MRYKRKLANKLPRKRKKVFIDKKGRGEYRMILFYNEIDNEIYGSVCRFPKTKITPRSAKGYDIVGYW